ncbi:hypothetical protein J3R82DRAFT_5224 [Butyriboletus roseoflavus]|nr:hypothetical protein J3R82DRAFT_5224 [Butyriboletus roseoflavus]
MLQLKNVFIVRKDVVQSLSMRFTFENDLLDGLMLRKQGVVEDTVNLAIINVCSDCLTYLEKGKMPCFALANYLYYSELPSQFQDLTWVEERICALYCSTIYVT